MKQLLEKIFKNENLLSILLIFLTTVIAYGINIPNLGYYYDDWYLLWSGQIRGAASIIPLFSTDRPFMGVVYSIVYHLLGDNLLGWHLYALLWRFICGLAFFWIVRLLWPKQKYVTALMAVLFIVYPGFLSQPDANTKQNHLFGFGTGLLSIAFMLQALKAKSTIQRVGHSLISIILTANYLFIYEYMIGLEGMRLALLGFALFQNGFKNACSLIVETLKKWWPYPIVTSGFLYWRIFIFQSSRNATDASQLASSYRSDLVSMSLRLIFETFKDFCDTTIFAWFVQPFRLYTMATYTDLFLAIFGALIVIVLVWLYSRVFKKFWQAEFYEEDTPNLIKDFLWIGIFITICAITPVILSAREFDPTDAYKSYGLHPTAGVILTCSGLLLMLQARFRKPVLLLLIGISVSTQLLNSMNWARYWKYERETWWQLTWRAPDIKSNTLVMAYLSLDFSFQQDYEIWGPINLIYRPNPSKIPLISAEVLNPDTALNILRGDVLGRGMRDFSMKRDFTKVLLITVPSENSCVHVIDGALPIYSEYESLLVRRVGSHSIINRIETEGPAPIPPPAIFGKEPEHTWCYYYQKASLARQAGDWDEISRLYNETIHKKLIADDESEFFPFIEGLINTGRYKDAQALFEIKIKGNSVLSFELCESLVNDPAYPPEFKYDYPEIHQLMCEL